MMANGGFADEQGEIMKFQIELTIKTDEDSASSEIITFERESLSDDTLGLSLNEAKALLTQVQQHMVAQQIAAFIHAAKTCSCGQTHSLKGHHTIRYQSLFGKLYLSSPRFYTCPCQDSPSKSFSPLKRVLKARSSPELLYLQSKWAALMSYGMTADLINDVLPITSNATTVYNHSQCVARRLESEVEEEAHVYIEGCEMEWAELPMPDMPLSVGIDGGYIRERQAEQRKAGVCEVIVGKSIPYQGKGKCFAYVSGDDRPKRRLANLLKSQGMQANQTVTFLSDGGDNVRDLQRYLSPQAEHLLDWFHVTMRITTLRQMLKGLKPHPDLWISPEDLLTQMERVKWFLWHGNVYKALDVLRRMGEPLESVSDENDRAGKIGKALEDFYPYIEVNRPFIPNYAERYHAGERISTGFVESAVNQVIAKRFAKKQQMRWTRQGAHQLLQIRVKVLNEEFHAQFQTWYPRFNIRSEWQQQAA